MNKVKKFLALSLALVMMLSVASFGAVIEFTDQEDIPAANVEAVNLLSALNILKGYDDGSFKPDGTITRAEAAKMIYVLCNNGIDDLAEIYKGQNLFIDVDAGFWAEGYINYCANVGIIAGRGNGVFDPNGNVTGYELMKMLLVVAEYKPAIQGYTGGSWAANVLRDASTSGMTKGCNFSMNDAAPRHWAARLFYNTILNVNAAVYIGDTLFTNPGILGDYSQTVGAKYLGLLYEKAVVFGTKTAKLNGGAGVYDYSTIQFFRSDNETLTGTPVDLNYDIPNEYLAQEVRVVYKLVNPNLDATIRNTTVFGVYLTGTSEVFDTTMDAVTVGATLINTSGKPVDNNISALTIKMEGYNGGAAKSYAYPGTALSKLAANIYDNQIKAYSYNANGAFSAATFYGKFNENTGDSIRFVDTDGDGMLDYGFRTETKYYMLNNLTTVRASFTTQNGTNLNLSVDDVNFIDEPEKNDVVAIVKNYSTGKLVYDVTKVEPTTVKATNWTHDGTDVTTVTLDGTAYSRAATSYSSALNKDHKVYFIDKGFVVHSDISVGDTALPSTVAVITAIGDPIPTVDTMGKPSYYFNVQHLRADGSLKTTRYDIASAVENEGIVGTWASGASEQEKVNATITALKAYIVTTSATDTTLQNTALLVYVPTDSGFYFAAKYEDYASRTSASYNDESMILSVGAGSGKSNHIVTDETLFFVRYVSSGSVKFAIVEGKNLKAFEAGDTTRDPEVGFIVENNGRVEAAYLHLTGSLPAESVKNNYAVITGAYRYGTVGNTQVMNVQVKFADDTTGFLDVPVTSAFFNGCTTTAQRNALITSFKNRVVRYSTSDGKTNLFRLDEKKWDSTNSKWIDLDYTTTPPDELVNDREFAYGQISNVSGSNFNLSNSGLMSINEDTAVFFIAGGVINAYTSPLNSVGANSAFVIWQVGTWANVAEVIVINGDVDADGNPLNVKTQNVAPAVSTTAPVTNPNPITAIDYVGRPVKDNVELAFTTSSDIATTATIVVQYRTGGGWATFDATDLVKVYDDSTNPTKIVGVKIIDIAADTYDFSVTVATFDGAVTLTGVEVRP